MNQPASRSGLEYLRTLIATKKMKDWTPGERLAVCQAALNWINAAPSEMQTHVHRCMSCGESWFCPHPPADCKAGESVFPTLQLRGPNGGAQFDHICQRQK